MRRPRVLAVPALAAIALLGRASTASTRVAATSAAPGGVSRLPTPDSRLPAPQPPRHRHRRPGALDARVVRQHRLAHVADRSPRDRGRALRERASRRRRCARRVARRCCPGRYGTEVGITDWISPAGERRRRRPAARDHHVGRGAAARGLPHRAHRQVAPRREAGVPSDAPRLRALRRLPRRRHHADEPAPRGERRRSRVPRCRTRRDHRRRAGLPRSRGRPPVRAVGPLPRAAHAVRAGARAGPGAVPRCGCRDSRVPRARPGAGAAVDARVLRQHPLDRPQHRTPARHPAAVRSRPDRPSSSSRATTATTSGTTACTRRATARGSSAASMARRCRTCSTRRCARRSSCAAPACAGRVAW